MSENSELIGLLRNYYKSKTYDFQQFNQEVKLMKDEEKEKWVIDTDRGKKPLKEYQWKLLNQIYSIFQVGRNQQFPGCDQSGGIHGSWTLKKSEFNSIGNVCNIFLFYLDNKKEYEYYHINVSTGKIRQISKIEEESQEEDSEDEEDEEDSEETSTGISRDSIKEFNINKNSLRKSTKRQTIENQRCKKQKI